MDIDLVYTWVDDKDPVWLEKKSKYNKQTQDCNKDSISDYRFFNNDELKYSLRSVEKNIPWINKIFIITDNQKPDWLNLNNEKICLVNHSEILPADKLPFYNSCAIELAIPNISQLSEYFIYANDDMLFWNPADKEFFFENDKCICRTDKKISPFKKYKHLYGYTIFHAYNLIKEKFNYKVPYFPHHNADSYRKSLFLACIQEFEKEYNKTMDNRFRDFSDLQRMVVSYYSLYKNEAVLKSITPPFFERLFKGRICESDYYDISLKTLKKIKNSKAKLMCVNDCRKTTNEARRLIKEILEEKFAEKSSFEL